MERVPKVSIGLPVYNGENYLAEAIESVLRQSFTDFELVISDNASTDRTPEIIAGFAAGDARIRWERQERNRGAAWNYDRTFAMSRAPYFKWLAHDDVMGETFLAEAVALLDAAPEFVGAISRVTTKIDGAGRTIGTVTFDLDPPDFSASERFAHYVGLRSCHCSPFFGLYRREDLLNSGLHGAYEASDLIFIGEMLLRGRIAHLLGTETYFRHHEDQFSRKILNDRAMVQQWLVSGQKLGPFRSLRKSLGYLRAIGRSRLTHMERFHSYAVVLGFTWRLRKSIAKDLLSFAFGENAIRMLLRLRSGIS